MSVEKTEINGKEPVDRQDTAAAQDPASVLSAITAERDKLAAEKADLQDRLLRAQAEFQNFRRRTEEKRVEMYEYASTEAVRMLLPVLDDFERALKAETKDKEYAAGIELIYNRFFEALKKLGLEPMDSKGQKFDPQIHHAVDQEETDKAAEDTILEEYQRGYNFKGRLLRPAMVKVAIEPTGK